MGSSPLIRSRSRSPCAWISFSAWILLIRGFSPNASKPAWGFSLLVAGDTPENQRIYQAISQGSIPFLGGGGPSALAPQPTAVRVEDAAPNGPAAHTRRRRARKDGSSWRSTAPQRRSGPTRALPREQGKATTTPAQCRLASWRKTCRFSKRWSVSRPI